MRVSPLLCRLAAVVVLTVSATAQTTQSPLPTPTGYVNDYARVIDAGAKSRLETVLTNLDRLHQIQFAVVTVDTTGDQDIFDYSLAVARGWGIGSKDTQKPSLLLFVAIKDRKYFTQVSRHLEGDLPDGRVGQIQRERLVPAFRAGNYGQGLSDTIDEYIRTVARKNGFSTEPIFGARATPSPRGFASRGSNICGSIVFLAVLVVVVLILIRRGGGRGYGGSTGGWFIWLLLSLLSSGRRSSSGWSGGGFGGFSGGSDGGFSGGSDGGFSSGGFGGFSGGGDFGGGGAGGSW